MKCPLCGKEDIPKENRSKYDLLYECLNCILYYECVSNKYVYFYFDKDFNAIAAIIDGTAIIDSAAQYSIEYDRLSDEVYINYDLHLKNIKISSSQEAKDLIIKINNLKLFY
jgi:hypothetical protein